MKSKNQLLSEFVKGYVHVSKKDYSFFSNLSKIIVDENRITSNQARLFDKLILKYQRQLKKQGCDAEVLLKLDWLNDVVETKLEFTQAKIFYNNNSIHIKAPFNTQFVQNFRRVILNPFVWDSNNKWYVADFSTYNLKLAVNYVKTYYPQYVYCDVIQNMLDKVDTYKSKYWNPTLVRLHDRFYIICINQSLYDKISHIELNDDPATLFELSNYGITIDESVTKSEQLLLFASTYSLTYDLEDLDNLVDMLSLLKVDRVFTAKQLLYTKEVSNEIKTKLLARGIACMPNKSESDEGILLLTSTVHSASMKRPSKIIQIKNSRPIHIK